jgi:hypothetical protein
VPRTNCSVLLAGNIEWETDRMQLVLSAVQLERTFYKSQNFCLDFCAAQNIGCLYF